MHPPNFSMVRFRSLDMATIHKLFTLVIPSPLTIPNFTPEAPASHFSSSTPPPKIPGAGANNIGHKMLSKMGWKEGQGLGATQAATAITTPVMVSRAAFLEWVMSIC